MLELFFFLLWMTVVLIAGFKYYKGAYQSYHQLLKKYSELVHSDYQL